MRPKILITLDTASTNRKGVMIPVVQTKVAYGSAVEKAGGIPLYVAPTEDEALLKDLVEHMDGLLVTGGHFDIPPQMFGQSVQRDVRLDELKPERTNFEAYLIHHAMQHHIPVLGICGGMQLLGALTGSRIIQDINSEIPNSLEHEQASSPHTADHAVVLCEESPLRAILTSSTIYVNSTHHQALASVSEEFLIEGSSTDGIIEMIRKRDTNHHVVGVQWHPELLNDRVSDYLYREFIRASTASAPQSTT